MEPKQRQYPVVDGTGDRSKVRCCKEQYCIGTWNVRSMNQGNLEVVKQEMARMNIDILGVSELKWTGMGKLSSLFLDGNGKKKGMANPMNSMKRRKDRILKDEHSRLVRAQYATGDQWRNNSRKNAETGPKQKHHQVVDVTGDGIKVRCCKEQYRIGTWNVRQIRSGQTGDGKSKHGHFTNQ